MWIEFIQTQQDLNLSWMDTCDFYSHAPALRNDCNSVSLFLSVSVIVSWTVLIFFSLSQGINSFWLFRTFWYFDVLSTGERKVSQSARFELAQVDPIWFRVRRLNHSPITAWGSSTFICVGHPLLNCCVNLYFLKVLPNYPLLGTPDWLMSSVM